VEPLVVAARSDHPLARRKTVTIADLRDQPLITLVQGSGLRTLLEAACRDAGFSPRITAETAELGSLAELAAAGVGVALLPQSAVRGTETVTLRVSRPPLHRRTALAWNRSSTSPAGRAFLALAEAAIPTAA
jgi:DNA-binding transcriptional LysR family regulator